MARRRVQTVAVSDAKRRLGDLVPRVAYGGETIILTRHGRPLVRIEPMAPRGQPAVLPGWLEDDDPFFPIMEAVIAARRRHRPRVSRPG